MSGANSFLPLDVWHEIVRVLVGGSLKAAGDQDPVSVDALETLSIVCRDVRNIAFPALIFVKDRKSAGSLLLATLKNGAAERLKTVSCSVALYRRITGGKSAPTKLIRRLTDLVSRDLSRGNTSSLCVLIDDGHLKPNPDLLDNVTSIAIRRGYVVQWQCTLSKWMSSPEELLEWCWNSMDRARDCDTFRWFAQNYPLLRLNLPPVFHFWRPLVFLDDPELWQCVKELGLMDLSDDKVYAGLLWCLRTGRRRAFRWLLQNAPTSILTDPEWIYDALLATRQGDSLDELILSGAELLGEDPISPQVGALFGVLLRRATLRGNVIAWRAIESSGRLTPEIVAVGRRYNLPLGCCRFGDSTDLAVALEMERVDFDPWQLYEACFCSHLDERAASLTILDSHSRHLLPSQRLAPLWKTALRNASVEKVAWFWERHLKQLPERQPQWDPHRTVASPDKWLELVAQRSPYTRTNSRKSRPPIEPVLDWIAERFPSDVVDRDFYRSCAATDNFVVARWLLRRQVWISEDSLERLFRGEAKRSLKLVLESTPLSVFCEMFAGGRWESFNQRLSPSQMTVSLAQRSLLNKALVDWGCDRTSDQSIRAKSIILQGLESYRQLLPRSLSSRLAKGRHRNPSKIQPCLLRFFPNFQ